MRDFNLAGKTFALLLLGAFIMQLMPIYALAQDGVRVENVRVQSSGRMVYVYYNLNGPPEQVYDVTLVMRSKSNRAFQYLPKSVSGDVGPNVFTGMDWRITWNTAKEFPDGLKLNDYSFEVKAIVVGGRAESRGLSTAVLVAGGAVVVGGVVALLLMNKKDQGTTQQPGFPAPPGRP